MPTFWFKIIENTRELFEIIEIDDIVRVSGLNKSGQLFQDHMIVKTINDNREIGLCTFDIDLQVCTGQLCHYKWYYKYGYYHSYEKPIQKYKLNMKIIGHTDIKS